MAEKEFNEEWVTDSEAAYAFYRANPDRAALAIAKIIANESTLRSLHWRRLAGS
jgi:hypothetical protein